MSVDNQEPKIEHIQTIELSQRERELLIDGLNNRTPQILEDMEEVKALIEKLSK